MNWVCRKKEPTCKTVSDMPWKISYSTEIIVEPLNMNYLTVTQIMKDTLVTAVRFKHVRATEHTYGSVVSCPCSGTRTSLSEQLYTCIVRTYSMVHKICMLYRLCMQCSSYLVRFSSFWYLFTTIVEPILNETLLF